MFVKSSFMRRCAVRALAIACVLAGMAPAVEARVFVGVGAPLYIGPPVLMPPPYYGPYYAVPPPWYGPPPGSTFNYTPPPAVPRDLAPRGAGPSGGGYSPSGGNTPSMGGAPTGGGPGAGQGVCRAGPYVCPLIEDVPLGGDCACPSHDGRPVRGRAG